MTPRKFYRPATLESMKSLKTQRSSGRAFHTPGARQCLILMWSPPPMRARPTCPGLARRGYAFLERPSAEWAKPPRPLTFIQINAPGRTSNVTRAPLLGIRDVRSLVSAAGTAYHVPNLWGCRIAAMTREKTGLWMIGAGGGVGSTVALGVAALAKRITSATGLVSALPPFRGIGLTDPASLVLGGHEVRSESLLSGVKALHDRANLFNTDLIRACAPRLRAMQRNVRPGTLCAASAAVRKLVGRAGVQDDRSPAEAVERISADISAFRKRHQLDTVVVVYLASCEPPWPKVAAHTDFRRLQRAMIRPHARVLPTSSIYALAAVEAGCAFVNFTPSLGIDVPAIRHRAERLGLPYMGNDGRTGETLVKSVLAPMFATRNLSVLSWIGQNILGNRDGAALSDPRVRISKLRSKSKTVSRILGPKTATRVSIDYVPSLDDWKVAWDFIHFEGFLGTKMSMQFTWYGSDSVLAAPLVIDLTRFASLAVRDGQVGPLRHLACFFKDPIEARGHDLFSQWEDLKSQVAPDPAASPSKRGKRSVARHGKKAR